MALTLTSEFDFSPTSTMENTKFNVDENDIKGEFQRTLEAGLDLESPFAFAKRFNDAPDPQLRIDGLGWNIQLPLNKHDASGIISASAPARIRGCVDVGVWSTSNTKVHFDNPAWQGWIRDVAGPAAVRALRADPGNIFVFNKVMLHEAGSQTMQLEDAETAPEKWGTLVVILPSLLAGGDLELRHDGQSKTVNFEVQSDLLTSMVASYRGVEQTLSAVTCGYRLSLVYDIVHLGARPPTLTDLQSPKQRLRNIMRSWVQVGSGRAPQFLACLLQNKYTPSAAFDVCSLVGEDRLLLSTLRALAQEQHFFICLGNIEVTVKAMVADNSQYGDQSVACYDDSFAMGEESFASFFTDDGDTENLVITQIVDLDGIPVKVEGLVDMDTTNLVNGRQASLYEPDSRSFDENANLINNTYKRTALMFWPEATANVSVMSVGNVCALACDALGHSDSVTPTQKT
ncbi:hypothetical protein C8R44DRAFT_184414 [Mycena epipterygia]|nr:hypothetical protein C8R44DRAFT_184414 [Mycena epipterygia]